MPARFIGTQERLSAPHSFFSSPGSNRCLIVFGRSAHALAIPTIKTFSVNQPATIGILMCLQTPHVDQSI